MNKKKKSTNTSPYPDEVIDRLARAFYPAILACWNSEEGQREFAAWQAEQAHLAGKEKQEAPSGGELPVEHTAVVCGLLQGASAGRTLFLLLWKRTLSSIRNKQIISANSQCSGLIQNPSCKFCTDLAALRPIGAFPPAQQFIF